MRLITDGFILSLQCRYDWLIRTFFAEELGARQPRLDHLVLRAERGDTCSPAGRVRTERNDRITITLYKAGLDLAQLLRHKRIEEGLDGKVAFNTFVLLHELAHVFQVYRDLPFYRDYIEIDGDFNMVSLGKADIEREADEIAAAFVRRHALFPVVLRDQAYI